MEQGLHAAVIEGLGTVRTIATCSRMLLAQPDIADLSKQVELALFYDAKLDVAAMT